MKIWRLAGAAALILLMFGLVRWFCPMPDLHQGDLIFQTSRSQQSKAILVASRSLYTHMGIVKHTSSGWMVVEAVGPVKETPLREWTQRGKFARVAVYRPKALTIRQRQQVFSEAKRLYGRPYDVYFSFENRAIYCSELAYLAFEAAGIELGERQRIGDLGVLKGPAKDLIAKRAIVDPECRGLDRKACMTKVLVRELVTPVSIARDQDLKKVYSNYPI
ncbi:YiiX/YebB-like N1pC/P60 family cysteine hydrolase [Asticcacaulis excentricus]|uniref:Peptidoglycan peptidase n=1 Tax=Asticcacaulis excentricus TaxID=78587 RepID=A0A3G9G859_9CAUL|nr:YiiX/YebB-like N1pC/P60 family cysteine hydrolase [Asticcacaulis excentricus]BBF80499.1 hypothetical protein EM6_1083 [Asticcacaulis excentricus]